MCVVRVESMWDGNTFEDDDSVVCVFYLLGISRSALSAGKWIDYLGNFDFGVGGHPRIPTLVEKSFFALLHGLNSKLQNERFYIYEF